MKDCIAHFLSYGVAFRLRADTPQELAEMTALVPYGSVAQPGSPQEAQEFAFSPDAEDGQTAEDQLRTTLMVHVANEAPDYVFLHSGVVSWKGKGLVLPGRSFAGKTTLVAALVRAGCLYYSDEYAIVSSLGLVHPYDRNLQVRQPGNTAQTPTTVGALGGQTGIGPLRVSLVAFLTYDPSAAWHPEAVTPGMAVLEMLRHAIPVQRTPGRVLATLTAMMSHAVCIRSSRAEAAPTVEALLSLLETA